MPSWKKVITSGSNAALNHITSSGNISGSAPSTGSFGQLDLLSNGHLRINQGGRGDEGGGLNNPSGITLFQSTTFTGDLTTTANLFSRIFDDNKLVLANHFNNAGGGISLRTMAGGSQTSAIDIAGNTGLTTINKGIVVKDSATINTDLIVTGSISGSATSTGSFGTIRTGTTVGSLSSGIVLGDGDSGIYETSDDAVVITAGNSLENFRVNATTVRVRADEFKINTSDNTTYGINLDTANNHNKISLIGSGTQTINMSKLGKFETTTTQNTSAATFQFTGSFDQIASFSATAQFLQLKPNVRSTNANATSSFATLDLGGTIDMSGQTQETIRGIYIHPTKTGIGNYIAIDADGDIVTSGNISGSSTSTGSFGKLAVGTATIQIPSNGFITMGSLDGMVMNTRFGNNAGQNLQAGGTQNVIVGEDAGAALTTGDTNVAVGSEALKTATGDSNNVAIGRRALHDLNATNARNVAVGTGAGDGMTSGTENVLLGNAANTSAVDGDNQIVIGSDATGTGDNQTVIGNSSQTHVVFGGDALVSGSAASTGSFGLVNTTEKVNLGSGGVSIEGSSAGTLTANVDNQTLFNILHSNGDGIGAYLTTTNMVNFGAKGSSKLGIGYSTGNIQQMVFNTDGNIGLGDSFDTRFIDRAKIFIENGGDVTINSDLIVTGSISGSSTSTGSFGRIVGVGVAKLDKLGLGTENDTPRLLQITATNTTNAAANIYTNAVHTGTTDNSVFSVRSDNASATGNVMNIHNDGSGASLTLNGDGKVMISGSASSTGSFGKLSVGSGNITTSGNMVLDADGAQIRLQDGGTEFGRISRVSSDLVIKSISNNNDILFKGVDGGGTITALQLDMSEGGNAIFNGNVQVASGGFVFSAGALTLQSGGGANLVLDAGAGADEITLSTSAFTTTVPIIATGDLDLYAGGGTKVVGLTTSAISLLKNTSISGNLAVDTNVLYVDSSANKVGINRIDPQFDLDVIGDIRATGDVIARRYVISSSVSHITSSFSSGSTIFGDTTGDIHQMTGSLRVTGSGNHYIQTGNIGIGTTSPTFAAGGGIHLKGSNGAFTSLRISVDSNTGVDFSSDSSGHGYMYNRANSDLIFGTNNTARIRVKNDGKVGIGTETPESILHIADGSSGAIGAKLIIDNNASDADGNGTEISFFNAAGASAAGVANSRIRSVASGNTNGYSQLQFWTYHASEAQRMVITSDGKIGIGTASPSKTFHAYANVSSDYAALVENDQATSGHGLQIHSDGNGTGTILFDVDAAGSSRFRVRGDGSVLVGFTTSQAEKLAVNGDFRATGNISGSSTSTGSFGSVFVKNQSNIQFGSINTRIRGDNSNNVLTFMTNNTERVRINDDGMGIGGDPISANGLAIHATNPGLTLRSSNTTGACKIRFADTGDNDIGKIEYGHNTNAMVFNTADAEAFRLDTNQNAIFGGSKISGSSTSTGSFGSGHISGKLGVGTTTIDGDSLLHLKGTDNTAIFFEDDDDNQDWRINGTSVLQFYDVSNSREVLRLGTQEAVFNEGGADLDFRVEGDTNSNLFTVDAGNEQVGIGVSPGAKLDIVGPSDGVNLRLSDVTGNSTTKEARIGLRHYTEAEEDTALMYAQSGNGTSAVYIGGGTGVMNATELIGFVTAATDTTLSGTTRMVINNSGNVGIGITNPQFKLHISGSTDLLHLEGSGAGGPQLRLTDNSATSDGDQFGLIDFLAKDHAGSNTTMNRISNVVVDNTQGTTDSRLTIQNRVNGTLTEVLSVASGKVGIGTTSPTAPLHVHRASGNTVAYFKANANPAQLNLAASTTDTNYVPAIRVDGNELRIFGGGVASYRPDGSNDIGYISFVSGSISGSSMSTASFGRIDVAGKLFVGGSQVGAGGGGSADNLGNHTATQDLDLNSKSIKNVIHITGSGNISGSSTSTASFGYVKTAGNGNVALFGDSTLADKYIAVRSTSNGAMFGIDASLNGGNGGVLISGGANKSFAIKVAESSTFGTNTPEFTIDTSGNVDITSGYLKVAAGATGEYFRVGGDDNNNDRALRFSSSTTSFTGDTHTINAPSAGGNIVFQTTSTERLRIDNAGNISGSASSTGSFGDGRFSGKLGINTTTPTARLDVNGSARVQGQLLGKDGNASSPAISFNADADTGIFRIGADNIGISTGGTRRIAVAATNTEFSTGIVSTKANGLISGSATSTGSFGAVQAETLFSLNGGRVATMTSGQLSVIDHFIVPATKAIFLDGGSDTFIIENTANQIAFAVANSVKMEISTTAAKFGQANYLISGSSTSTGSFARLIADGSVDSRVGIGTPSPVRSLDIHDGGANGFINLRDSTKSLDIGTATHDMVRFYEGGDVRMTISGSNVGIGVQTPDSKLEVNGTDLIGNFAGSNAGFYIRNNTPNYISFQGYGDDGFIFKDGGNERIRFESGGNVGMGITAPVGRLHLKSTGSAPSGSIAIQHSGNTVNIVEIGQSDNGNSAGAIILDKNNGVKSVHIDGHGSSFFNGGNVGFGTELDPDTTIHLRETDHVYLTIESQNTGAAREAAIKYQNYTTGTNFWWVGMNDGNDPAYSIAYGSALSNGNTKLIVLESGNVGIGTTNPGHKLHVVGDIRATGDLIANRLVVSSSVSHITASFSSGSTIFGDTPDDSHRFTGSLFISGSSGVEVTNPSPIFRLNDTNVSGLYHRLIGGGNAGLEIGADTGNVLSSAYIRFDIGNSEKVRIVEDGSVGIGTSNPNSELTVGSAGSSGFRTIRVQDQNYYVRLGAGNSAANQRIESNSNLDIRSNSTTAIYANTSQNVTVGSTNPPNNSSRLGVAGDVNVGNGQSQGTVYFENSGTDVYIQGNASKLQFGHVGNTQSVQVTAGGNIVLSDGDVSGSATSTGSFGSLVTSGDIQAGGAINIPFGEVLSFEGDGGNTRVYSNSEDQIFFDIGGVAANVKFQETNNVFAQRVTTLEDFVSTATGMAFSGSASSTGSFGALSVPGQATIGSVVEASSIMYKENVKQIESPLEKITKLRGVEFDYKKTNEHSIGMIAEEVNEIFPELVAKNEDGDVTAMSYTRMTAVLLEAVKELSAEVKELRKLNNYNKSGDKKK